MNSPFESMDDATVSRKPLTDLQPDLSLPSKTIQPRPGDTPTAASGNSCHGVRELPRERDSGAHSPHPCPMPTGSSQGHAGQAQGGSHHHHHQHRHPSQQHRPHSSNTNSTNSRTPLPAKPSSHSASAGKAPTGSSVNEAAVGFAHDNSLGFFVGVDARFGNHILPVIPRLE